MDMIFNFMITDWKSDILCLSETWLRPSGTVDTHLTQENFTLFRRDRPSRSHGGLLVYVRNHVQVRRRPDLELRELECITLELTVPSPITRHLLFCCYRPPDQHPDTFFSPLRNLLAKAEDESPQVTLLGDFNAKHPSWDETSTPNTAGTKMMELLTEFGLTQMIMEPTRYSFDGNTRSVIDLYATNRPDLVRSTSITDPVSDHCCVTI